MPMSKPQCFDAQSTIHDGDQTADAIGIAEHENTESLRYSSPWPWMLALSISLSMWTLMAWLIW